MVFRSDSQRKAMFANIFSNKNVHSFSSKSYPADSVLSTEPKYVYDGGINNQFSETSELDEVRNKLRGYIKRRKDMKSVDPEITKKLEKTLLDTYPDSEPVGGEVIIDADMQDKFDDVISRIRDRAEREDRPGDKAALDIEANVLEKTIADTVERQKKSSNLNVGEADEISEDDLIAAADFYDRAVKKKRKDVQE